jgi:hypothetical protein
MSIYDVIDSKVIDYGEVIVCLFEHCNLQCSFCPQDHDSLIGVSRDEIMSKVPRIVDWINANNRSKYFKLHIMGGELFQDKWINAGFLDFYQEMMDSIRKQVPCEKDLQFNYVTNLVFDETDAVLNFLNKNNLKVSISYDSNGRFTKNQFAIFKRNVELFKDKIEMVSLVLTKQNIVSIIKGDPYFDYLYANFPCDWDSFLPSVKMSKAMMPKESELLEFYKHLVDHYPNCLNIEHFTSDKETQKMTCTRGNNFTVLHDNSEPKGCSGTILLKDGNTQNLNSGEIVINFFKTYNCFECEYYKKCPFTCFVKNDYKHIEKDVKECVFKLTFDYAKRTKNNI